jgi:hypothetical protein
VYFGCTLVRRASHDLKSKSGMISILLHLRAYYERKPLISYR